MLRIGFDQPSKIPGRLVSFGRLPQFNDVILLESCYAKTQCYFAFHNATRELLLHDVSTRRTTILDDRTDGKHWDRVPRQGIVPLHRIEMTLKLVRAEFILKLAMKNIRQQGLAFVTQNPPSPTFADTRPILEAFSCLTTRYETRVHTPFPCVQNNEIIYEDIRYLGQGSFGFVIEVVDIYSGDHYAVKVLTHTEYSRIGYSTEGA